MGQDGTDWGPSWTSSRHSRAARRPPGRWWHPEGDNAGVALSTPPFHSNVSPYRQSGLSNLRVGRQIRSPNKSETEVSTRRGFRSELYPNSWRRQTRGRRRLSRANFTSLLADGNPAVMSRRHALDPRQPPPALLETGRDRSPRHARRAPDRPRRFAVDSRADYRDEAVGSPTTRSLSERWLIHLVASILRPSIPL
jgi:hypothetical protein